MNNSSQDGSAPAKIPTEHIPDTSIESYRWASSPGDAV
jgi:hypothetical protein